MVYVLKVSVLGVLCLSLFREVEVSDCVLTPHVLSEWMVEVCRFDMYRYQVPV